MDFKDYVLGDVKANHLKMINGEAPQPFASDMSLVPSKTYSENRDRYLERLENEREEFNKSLDKIKTTHRERLEKERHTRFVHYKDLKKYIPCLASFFVLITILFIIIYLAMQDGVAYWVKDVLVEEMGIHSFFALFSHYGDNTGYETGIAAIVLACCLWVGLIIYSIILYNTEFVEWPLYVLVGGLLLGGLPIMLPFLLIRLLMVALGYLIYFILTPFGIILWGIISLIPIIILGIQIRSTGFKIALIVTIFAVIAFTGGLCYHGANVDKIGKKYYAEHNGMSFESAKELSVNSEQTVYFYGENDAYYFVITPEKDGIYQILSYEGGYLSIYLYTSGRHLIQQDIDKDVLIEQMLFAGDKYYIKVVSKRYNQDSPDNFYRGHYKIIYQNIS